MPHTQGGARYKDPLDIHSASKNIINEPSAAGLVSVCFSFLEQLARRGRSLLGEGSERMRGPTVRYSARKEAVSIHPSLAP